MVSVGSELPGVLAVGGRPAAGGRPLV